jgi:phosphomannomutase
MVTRWGFSEKLGHVAYGDNQEEVFLGHSVARQQNVSEETAQLIDAEVRRLIDEAYKEAHRDADRCFFIDGGGEFIAGDFITALLAEAALLKSPGQKVIYDVRASYAVKDTVAEHGGTALMNRVGHAFIKRRMREENAVFGGEVTGHYYFRDFHFADNGFIPALLILELMSRKNMTLRDLLAPLREKYFLSGEINTRVSDVAVVQDRLTALAAKYQDGHTYTLDGFSAEFPDWHFNVRGSNTEPLLRLNLEATTAELMSAKRDEVLGVIRSAGA